MPISLGRADAMRCRVCTPSALLGRCEVMLASRPDLGSAHRVDLRVPHPRPVTLLRVTTRWAVPRSGLLATVEGPMAEPQAPTRQPWAQQPGENSRWYARFLRYLALGPGRSVSLVANGRRNAYPIPAHWPIQAKQKDWKVRAEAFDAAVRADPTVARQFDALVVATREHAPESESNLLMGVHYTMPPPDDEDYSSALAAT